MKNEALLSKKIEESLTYLYNQEQRLKPILDKLEQIIISKKDEEISLIEALKIFLEIQNQYTNNILLITKIKEIIDFRD